MKKPGCTLFALVAFTVTKAQFISIANFSVVITDVSGRTVYASKENTNTADVS